MDNVVQNINISDIIPSKFQPSHEEKQKINDLAKLIKEFGLLEPIIVRPKAGKYEIILGMDKYEAALIAGLKIIPVIIKEIDDEIYSKYASIDNLQNVSSNTQSSETNSKKRKNSDVINLDELSKIKLEYERDDVKMNNGQFNNDMANNNLGLNGQSPAFGGSFFPSLEDEPTNMNMMGGIGAPTAPPLAPTFGTNDFNNNNLIDLTDLTLDKENSSMPMPNLGINSQPPVQNPIPDMPANNNFDIPNFGNNSSFQSDNIINIESLQNNNPMSRPVNEPVPMDILNADFGPPSPPQFDNNFGAMPGMNQQFMTPPPAFTDIPNQGQPNYGMSQPAPMMGMPQQAPGFDMNMVPPMQNNNFGAMPAPGMPIELNSSQNKDATPVINTIKNLATSLEAFGYKININEEQLPNSSKIIIEVEK